MHFCHLTWIQPKKQPIKENFGMVNQFFFLSEYPKIGLVLYNLTFSQNSLKSNIGSQHLMECIYVLIWIQQKSNKRKLLNGQSDLSLFFSEYISLDVGKFLYDLKLIMRHFLRTHLIWQVFIDLETNPIFSQKKETWVLCLKRNWNRVKTLQIDVSHYTLTFMNSQGFFKNFVLFWIHLCKKVYKRQTINWYFDLMKNSL